MDHIQDIKKIVKLLNESQYDKKPQSGKPYFVDPVEGGDQTGWFVEIDDEIHGPFDSREEVDTYVAWKKAAVDAINTLKKKLKKLKQK
jgi:hypothetical protein